MLNIEIHLKKRLSVWKVFFLLMINYLLIFVTLNLFQRLNLSLLLRDFDTRNQNDKFVGNSGWQVVSFKF